MNACERQLQLGFDARSAQHPELVAEVGGVGEQRRLADSGFATEYQRAALPVTRRRDEVFDARPLWSPAVQHAPIVGLVISLIRAFPPGGTLNTPTND